MVHKGFYDAAANGVEFVPAAEVASAFGSTVDANFMGTNAGAAFLKFARTYWSFRRIERDARNDDCNTIARHVLYWLDTRIAPLFFPHGTGAIPVSKRRKDQRQFLELFAPREMDIEGFLAANPILAAEGRGQSRWLGWAVVIGAVVFLLSRC